MLRWEGSDGGNNIEIKEERLKSIRELKSPLPNGTRGVHVHMDPWIQVPSKRCPGFFYYYNTNSGESSWSKDTKLRASHILVKHRESRKPSSWRDGNITRTKEEAVNILRQYQTKLKEGTATFAEIASKYSDCSSAKKAGDLGPFEREKMQKPFSDAVVALNVGEMSDIVYTDSGVHLILRT